MIKKNTERLVCGIICGIKLMETLLDLLSDEVCSDAVPPSDHMGLVMNIG